MLENLFWEKSQILAKEQAVVEWLLVKYHKNSARPRLDRKIKTNVGVS